MCSGIIRPTQLEQVFNMNDYHLIFEGSLRLSLEGNSALLPINQDHRSINSFCIGSENTNIVVRDHRSKFIDDQLTFNEKATAHFLEAFQKTAWAEVRYRDDDENMEIDLYDSDEDGELPILWLGVLENNFMPGYKVEWEVFKALSEDRTAFAALIP